MAKSRAIVNAPVISCLPSSATINSSSNRPPAFTPLTVDPMPDTLERFDYLQQEVQVRIDRSAGLALDRLRVVSPFDSRIKYNLYAAFCLLAAHQRRHLWQAEQLKQRLTTAD